jgi:hypothetical protein
MGLGSLLFILLALTVSSFVRGGQILTYTFRQLQAAGVQSATAVVTEEGISITRADGNSFYKWPAVKRIWKTEYAWMFFAYSDHFFVVIPAASIGPALQTFIAQNARRHSIFVK